MIHCSILHYLVECLVTNTFAYITITKNQYNISILAQDDQQMYMKISNALSAPTSKNKRNTKASNFLSIINAIVTFQNHREPDKWKRCLITGIVKFEDGIAININRFKSLVHKCKTSINSSLRMLGYANSKVKPDNCKELLAAIPSLANNKYELRNWSIRIKQKKQTGSSSSQSIPELDLIDENMQFFLNDDDDDIF